jgi:dihydrofolate reductase
LFFASIDTVPPTQTHEIERKEQGHGVASVRKVVVYEFMCLDGVAENIAGIVTGWDDDEVDAAGAAVIATQDAVILGRRSYDEWAPFWPGSEIEPFATFINTVPKYVATSAPLDSEWANASAIDGGLVTSCKT